MAGVNGNMLFTPNCKLYKIMFTLGLMNTLQHMQIVMSVYLSPEWKQKKHAIYTKCGLHCDMRWHLLRIVHSGLYKLHLLYVNTSWILEQDWNNIIFEDRDQLNI